MSEGDPIRDGLYVALFAIVVTIVGLALSLVFV